VQFVIVVSLIAIPFIGWFYLDATGSYDSEERIMAKLKIRHKWLKCNIIIFVISAIINVFTPSKEVAVSMLAANVITPDNIVIAEDHIVELIEKIMTAVNKY
jgi:hypothetical protein